jgi:hypothetical protein
MLLEEIFACLISHSLARSVHGQPLGRKRHSDIGTTEEYLKNFKSRQARKDQDSFSPVNRLNKPAKQKHKKSGGMFESGS